MSLEVKGVELVVGNLDKAHVELVQAAAAGLYQAGEAMMADSKANFVPVDTGTLKNSGFVEQPVIDEGLIQVTLGYGGAAEDYAVVQHERLDYHHAVGGPKYLERPVLNAAKSLTDHIAERLRTVTGG